MFKNLNIFIVSIACCLTMPGLAETYSIYLGDYGIKLIALLLLFLNLNKIGDLLKNPKIKAVMGFMLLLFIYRTFNSTSVSQEILLPLISLLWIIIIYSSIQTEKHFRIFIFCLYLSSCVVLLSPGLERIFDFSRITFSEARADHALIGIAKHYIVYGQMAIISLFSSLFFLTTSKSNVHKFFALIILLISIIGIVTSGSRGAILASLVSIIFLLYSNRKFLFKKKFKFSLIFLLGISIFIALIPFESLLTNFQVMGTKSDYSSINRLYLFNIALESFYNSPIFGNGWGYVRLLTGSPPHSMFIQLLAELGLLGLIFEFIIYNRLFVLFKSLKYKLKANDINTQKSMNILLSMLVAFGTWSSFENLGFALGNRQIYIVAVLIICFHKTVRFNKFKQ